MCSLNPTFITYSGTSSLNLRNSSPRGRMPATPRFLRSNTCWPHRGERLLPRSIDPSYIGRIVIFLRSRVANHHSPLASNYK